MPYVAFDYIIRNDDLFLGLVSHTGLFSFLEPADSETLSIWREVEAFYPFSQLHRSSEPSLCLSFHHPENLVSNEISLELDQHAISFAVTYAKYIKLYRAARNGEGKYTFHHVYEMSINSSIIRSIAWAPQIFIASSLIAVLSDDNITHLLVVHRHSQDEQTSATVGHSNARPSIGEPRTIQRSASSGISADLSVVSRSKEASNGPGKAPDITFTAEETASLAHEDGSAMNQIEWNFDGNVSGLKLLPFLT